MVSIYCEWWKTYPMHTHTHKYFLLPEDAFNWRYPFSLRQFKNPKKEARKFRENVIHLEGPVTHWTIGCVFLNSFPLPPLRTPQGKNWIHYEIIFGGLHRSYSVPAGSSDSFRNRIKSHKWRAGSGTVASHWWIWAKQRVERGKNSLRSVSDERRSQVPKCASYCHRRPLKFPASFPSSIEAFAPTRAYTPIYRIQLKRVSS